MITTYYLIFLSRDDFDDILFNVGDDQEGIWVNDDETEIEFDRSNDYVWELSKGYLSEQDLKIIDEYEQKCGKILAVKFKLNY